MCIVVDCICPDVVPSREQSSPVVGATAWTQLTSWELHRSGSEKNKIHYNNIYSRFHDDINSVELLLERCSERPSGGHYRHAEAKFKSITSILGDT